LPLTLFTAFLNAGLFPNPKNRLDALAQDLNPVSLDGRTMRCRVGPGSAAA
jgi:hypothetical protein